MCTGGKLRSGRTDELHLVVRSVFRVRLSRPANRHGFEPDTAVATANLGDTRVHRVTDLEGNLLAFPVHQRLAIDERFPLPIEIEEDRIRSDLDDDAIDFIADGDVSLTLGGIALFKQRGERIIVAPVVTGAHGLGV